ncbi:MAG: condensation domain-containing protein, partial [Nitrospira sp.]
CRYRTDGVIEFLGRVDRQVKIRGHRIEPSEIETALRQHEAVAEAVLVIRDELSGDKRLIAYVQQRPDNPTDSESLRRYLMHKLPSYMVPAQIVLMDRWPLSPNGKIDRRALPLPDVGHGARSATNLMPLTLTEELLASIWAEILGVESARRDDDFFALGGHSLLATQLVSRVIQIFQVELPVRALFECPTLTELANRIEGAQEQHGGPRSRTIVPIPRHAEPVVSFAQERLWFLDKLEPGNPFYNVSGAFHVAGRLRHDVLVQSLTEIIHRHEVLRTNFPVRDGRPIPMVHEPDTFPVPIVDLRGLAPEQREGEVTRRMLEEAEHPFDLAQGSLLRVVCLQMAEDEQVLLVTMHHIISDGWSIGLLIREVSSLYDAFVSGGMSPLAPLPVQYTDFAHWQRQHLAESFDVQVAYWKQRLGEDLPVLDLPCDRPRPAEFRYQGRTVPFVLSARLSQALRALSQREGLTLFISVLAALKILLFRYTGQPDLVVGTPIANRTRTELEGLIGFFVNSLVLRTDLSGSPTVRDVLRRVRETCLEAYAHQDLPFEKLVDVLKPNRDLSRTPLFQVMLAFQNVAVASLKLQDVVVTPLDMETRTTPFDLVLDVDDSAEELKGFWQYNSDLFDDQTVQRMSSHWVGLLGAMVEEPEGQVSELPILSLAERTQLLVEWNTTGTGYPDTQTIQELFEAQVERTPEATAVSMHDVMLSYRELDARSNRLAAYLRKHGVGAESRVALLVERSPTMVIAAMAVMKAGGAYVPLDPTYPTERLKLMLA